MENRPLVSVIMNCFNSARYLPEAINSVYAQTFKDWEIVFFDNASTDESAAIAQTYDGRLKYCRNEKTVPLGMARNLAIQQAQGRYIAFLDCDDIWLPTKLEKQIEFFRADPSLGLVFSDALFFSEHHRQFRMFPHGGPPQGKVFRRLMRRYYLPMPTIIIRRDVLDSVGGWFDERFNMVEDADLFMRIAYYFPIAYVDEPLARRRMHRESWTVKKKELFPKESEALIEKFSTLWPDFSLEYFEEVNLWKAMVQYQYAVLDWEKGDSRSARERLRPYLKTRRKIWAPYLFSYGPYWLFSFCKWAYRAVNAFFRGSVDTQVY